MFINWAHNILKIIAYEGMYNYFPPHLSCVATLPENVLTEKARCFLSVGGCVRLFVAKIITTPGFLE